MILFPKLPALRGKRARYQADGYVSSVQRNPHWRPDDSVAQFANARLLLRTANKTELELKTLNFASLHGAAAHGEISIAHLDNNGYSWPIARWKKTAQGWN